MPALGHAMEECVFVEWLAEPGSDVTEGQDIAVIETDKSEMELTAPATGRLGKHLVSAGSHVPVGTVVAYVLGEGEQEPASVADMSDEATPAQPAEPASVSAEPAAPAASGGAPSGAGGRHASSPRQRRLARQSGSAENVPRSEQPGRSRPGTARAALAAMVAESWSTIPHFAVSRDIPAGHLTSLVSALRAEGRHISVTDVLLRAFALSLRDRTGDREPHLGLAVATEDGVSIPVIPSPADRGIEEIARLRAAAVERARLGRATTDDALPVTATLSNLGAKGVRSFTGVIPLGQTMLLTTGAVATVVRFADGSIRAEPVFDATINLDHRVFDGAHGADLLQRLAEVVADGTLLRGTRTVDTQRESE